jgi:hypothetical protein
VKRNCDSCGVEYEAKTARSRFHSATCRVRASRGVVIEMPAASRTSTTTTGSASPAVQLTGVLGATYRELEAAERIETAYGQAAMVLARRIDAGRDTGSAMATMTRQLRETLAEALKGARREGSKLDELTAKRQQRLGRGA